MAGFFDGVGSFLGGSGNSNLGFTSFEDGGLLGSSAGKTGLGIAGSGLDFMANRKDRKSEEQRFNKMFDFKAGEVARTNKLEDDRQNIIDDYYNKQV